MYLRAVHSDLNIPLLRQFIRENPLGILTTAIKFPPEQFIQSSHIPWLLDVADESSETELGTLRGHMARANPQTKAIIGSASSNSPASNVLEEEVLILFNGPAHHYVTPKFYRETKPTTGKVVPTWDYSAVQVYGKAKIYYDTKAEETGAFLAKQLHDLSQLTETSIMGYGQEGKPKPWQVSDAPTSYVDLLKKAIIGIEIDITSMAGKFKMSQELSQGDRDGVIDGFNSMDTDLGREIARTVKWREEVQAASKAK